MEIEVAINVCDECSDDLAELYDGDSGGGSWTFCPTDKDSIVRAMAFLQKNLPADGLRPHLCMSFGGMEDVETANLRSYPYLQFPAIAIKSRKRRMPDEWHDVVTCPDCGNKYADPSYEVPLSLWKPKKKYSLFSVDSSHNLYAHSRHIPICEKAGLTRASHSTRPALKISAAFESPRTSGKIARGSARPAE